MAARETKAAVIARLEAALDAAVQENVRMAGELANMEAGTNALVDLAIHPRRCGQAGASRYSKGRSCRTSPRN